MISLEHDSSCWYLGAQLFTSLFQINHWKLWTSLLRRMLKYFLSSVDGLFTFNWLVTSITGVVITGHTLGSYWHHTLASHPAPSRHQQPRSALRPRQLLPMTSMLQRIISALLQHVLLCFILIDTGKENIVFTYHHQQGRLRCYLKCRCLQWFTRVTDAVELSVSLVNTNTTLPGPGVPPPHTGAAV